MKAVISLVALALFAGSAAYASKPNPEETAPLAVLKPNATIQWANRLHTIRNYSVRADKTLLIRTDSDRYYRATLFGACPQLTHSVAVKFRPEFNGDLTSNSSIVVDGQVCRFDTLDEVADPNPKP